MTKRKLAMSILAIIILLEVGYYLLYLKPSNDAVLTMTDLHNDAKMQQIFERELDDLKNGDARRARFKYIWELPSLWDSLLHQPYLTEEFEKKHRVCLYV
ncbi:hypothetical protein [Paenibacillus caui]|uniref:hypothetical protein n=1 Tax=Paenibacillus caui TaxID=2873927 RepID=UPI001CA80508|nr:hypothetical protein [Paenibacillus caui]